MATTNTERYTKRSDDDMEDWTSRPFYELEAFDSIWQAL